MKFAVIAVLGILLAVVVTTKPALACEGEFASGYEFGFEHVAVHAMEGMLDGGCNPGMHSGYSHWAP